MARARAGSSTEPEAKPSKPSQREWQKDLTRRRLVQAATAVFARDGYSGSRVEDIAAEAGLSRATFYLHFSAKIDVVRELMGPLRADSEGLYRALDELGALGEPSWRELYDWMSSVTDYWARNRAAITVVNQAIGVEPALAGYLVDSAGASADVMTRTLSRWPPDLRQTVRLRIVMFILALARVCFCWIIQEVPFDEVATLTGLTDSFYTALHPGKHPAPPG
jgi:AcrR family transcriptional regulator